MTLWYYIFKETIPATPTLACMVRTVLCRTTPPPMCASAPKAIQGVSVRNRKVCAAKVFLRLQRRVYVINFPLLLSIA